MHSKEALGNILSELSPKKDFLNRDFSAIEIDLSTVEKKIPRNVKSVKKRDYQHSISEQNSNYKLIISNNVMGTLEHDRLRIILCSCSSYMVPSLQWCSNGHKD